MNHIFNLKSYQFLQKSSQKSSKIKIMVFQGSPRNKDSCPDMDGKTSFVVKHAIQDIKDVDIDICDLKIQDTLIQPCKSCYSTAGGYHCHWPCSCYQKNSKDVPDLMYNEDIYERLSQSDGFILYAPIHWYSIPSQVKAMFDRLVCSNLTLPYDFVKKTLGKDFKNSEITRPLSESHKYDKLLTNHLEGKFGAFFIHGDDGSTDYDNKKLPSSMIAKEDPFMKNLKLNIMPIVCQCRYSGINVPNDLIEAVYINKDVSYSKANDLFKNNKEFLNRAKGLLLKLIEYIIKKRGDHENNTI